MVLFFIAYWNEDFVHHMIRGANIGSPYVIAPPELRYRKWEGTSKWGHGNALGYEAYARIIQRALAEVLEWPKVEESEVAPDRIVNFHPPNSDLLESLDQLCQMHSRKQLLETYEPAQGKTKGCVGPMDCSTGRMGRATTFLLKRAKGSRQIKLAFRRVKNDLSLYPQTINVRIRATGSHSEMTVEIPDNGDEVIVAEVPFPDSTEVGDALEVEIRAGRTSLGNNTLVLRSVFIDRIWQES
ncbi:MAG: hypothetical protein GY906_21420 [bacterium]|nr:hypothetical protein [bacterium]